MNIILFPTRFYPAISGGDFYMQRIGESLKRNFNANVRIFTTNAIDFGALHGEGRCVPVNHKNYLQYHNLELNRFTVKGDSPNKNAFLLDQMQNILNFSEDSINFFLKNGPILPEMDQLINLDRSLFWDKFVRRPFENKPQDILLHTTYLPYLNLVYSLLLCKKLKIPCVTTPFLHTENIRYQSTAIYHLLNQFDAIITCTQEERKNCIHNGINTSKIFVLPMGIDINKFQKDYRHRIAEKSLKKYRILFCGTKNYEKGAITLLQSIPLFKDPQIPISFIFIGPSTMAFNMELAKIKAILPSHLNILNFTPDNLNGVYDPKKIAAFQWADIYCMPSRSDAYGIAYLEAWASQKPVIAADFPQMREVISNQKDGLLVPFDNIEELKIAIEKLLLNPKLRNEMGMHGFKRIQCENSWELITQKTYNIYQQILKTQEG